jgi:hypothetical protein
MDPGHKKHSDYADRQPLIVRLINRRWSTRRSSSSTAVSSILDNFSSL